MESRAYGESSLSKESGFSARPLPGRYRVRPSQGRVTDNMFLII